MMNASEAARALRAIPSELRTETSRENGKKGGRPKGSVDSEAAKAAKKTAQQQRRQSEKQNAAGNYDLTALRVDVTTPSNSETGFEED